MSVLQSIQNALSGVGGLTVGVGRYPDTPDMCAKIILTADQNKSDKPKPAGFLGGGQSGTGAFKVIVRGDNYCALEQAADSVKGALTNAGYIPVGGYEDVESGTNDAFMQLAVHFKFIK